MDHAQWSPLQEALTAVPDPRKARGKQLEWSFMLAMIATAIGTWHPAAHRTAIGTDQ